MDIENNNKTTKQVNKLQSLYLVVSTLNLQHSLKLLVIFKVAFWDDWPSFIWRRAVFCSTLSTWHHLASIIMRPGFTVPLFYFGVPPYQICLYLKVSLKSLSCLKLKLETFHMAWTKISCSLLHSHYYQILPALLAETQTMTVCPLCCTDDCTHWITAANTDYCNNLVFHWLSNQISNWIKSIQSY